MENCYCVYCDLYLLLLFLNEGWWRVVVGDIELEIIIIIIMIIIIKKERNQGIKLASFLSLILCKLL